VEDGIDGLLRILRNEGGRASGGIFNLGNPRNDCSVRELAATLCRLFAEHPLAKGRAAPRIVEVTSESFYGEGYQDVQNRTPSIRRARQLLGWEPEVELEEALRRTLDAFLEEAAAHAAAEGGG
jgi:UDP-4-amino-4-deoxy-L-arabinose formyltransferase/UDP-glucuronic acid dehydrogenase (UDP-4-keto-hexauronic acid decarboxylating)